MGESTMETVFCPKCRAINNKSNSICGSCHQPLKRLKTRKPKLALFLLLVFLLVLLVSGGALIYVEVKYPDYALRRRLTYSWEILFHKDWLKKYGDYKSLEREVRQKKQEKTRLIQEIKKIQTEKKNKIRSLEKRIIDITKKLDAIEKK